jgi:hypothetical protein
MVGTREWEENEMHTVDKESSSNDDGQNSESGMGEIDGTHPAQEDTVASSAPAMANIPPPPK